MKLIKWLCNFGFFVGFILEERKCGWKMRNCRTVWLWEISLNMAWLHSELWNGVAELRMKQWEFEQWICKIKLTILPVLCPWKEVLFRG